jgi:hypothetical protein
VPPATKGSGTKVGKRVKEEQREKTKHPCTVLCTPPPIFLLEKKKLL